MNPTDIISVKMSGKSVCECQWNDGIWRTIIKSARIIGIHAPSLRQRIKNWGVCAALTRKKSPLKHGKQRELAIKLDIVDGDLEGKYVGRTCEAERRALLDAIPSVTELEKSLWA